MLSTTVTFVWNIIFVWSSRECQAAVHEICSGIGFPSGYVESQRRASKPLCWILHCFTSWISYQPSLTVCSSNFMTDHGHINWWFMICRSRNISSYLYVYASHGWIRYSKGGLNGVSYRFKVWWIESVLHLVTCLTLRRLTSYIYIWSTHSWCF